MTNGVVICGGKDRTDSFDPTQERTGKGKHHHGRQNHQGRTYRQTTGGDIRRGIEMEEHVQQATTTQPWDSADYGTYGQPK